MRQQLFAALVAALTCAAAPSQAGPAEAATGARAGVDVTSATPRPGVPRRSDVYTGKFEGRATAVGRRIPPGYRAVWDDGRLNPHRGPRTAAGDAQMRRLWTDTVPMEGVGPGG